MTFMGMNVYDGIAIGFFALLVVALVLDRFGTAMFKRGFAKPFYFRKHRIHHRTFLLLGLPVAYMTLATLIIMGVIKVIWRLLWPGLMTTMVIGVACIAVDLFWDHRATWRVRWGLLHHELIYLAVPLFAFSDFLRLVV